jgi:hypothetical protein
MFHRVRVLKGMQAICKTRTNFQHIDIELIAGWHAYVPFPEPEKFSQK